MLLRSKMRADLDLAREIAIGQQADTWSQLALASGGAVLSCALFGLTYR